MTTQIFMLHLLMIQLNLLAWLTAELKRSMVFGDFLAQDMFFVTLSNYITFFLVARHNRAKTGADSDFENDVQSPGPILDLSWVQSSHQI